MNSTPCLRVILVACSICAFALVGASVRRSGQTSPTGPTVAILPLANDSGEKWTELNGREAKHVAEYLTGQFTQRKFRIVPDQDVQDALKSLAIDLNLFEDQKTAMLKEIGHKLNADYVVFGVMLGGVRHSVMIPLLLQSEDALVDVRIWFLDLKHGEDLVRAKTFQSKGSGIDSKASDIEAQRVSGAFYFALKDFFKGYDAGLKGSR